MKKNIWKRVLSLVLCMVLVASYLPTGIFSVVAEGNTARAVNVTKVADLSTKDAWKNVFGDGTGSISTENAGGVWPDKSVFKNADEFANILTDSRGNDVSVTMKDEDGLLVALSAIASNMVITGESNIPTDTMLVLDVSGSMNDDDGNNDVAEELAEAANTTIHQLLSADSRNRVGVVLYSGPTTISGSASANDSVLLLPLGRYTTGSDNEYVTYTITGNRNTTETIGLDSDVVIEGSQNKPSAVSKEVVGATYIQKGVIQAMGQFTSAANQNTIQGTTRKPVMVLMSDGAPTVTDTDFTEPGSYNLGTGSSNSTNAAQGFVTQLSCAYAKAQIETAYNNDMLFYTVGLGTTSNEVATSVLDPANSNSGINTFWTQYQAAQTDGRILVENNRGTNNDKYVTKIATALEKNYVDTYIPVNEDTDLAQGLKDAFAQIVGDIELQSKYYPTLVGTNDDLSGYISFVDRIGSYMSVTDVKGILLHNQLFSGADMAHHFVPGGGGLGTVENPTALGDELVFAVRERLGLANNEAARTLIGLAYQYGQLRYTSETDFSNYIGWYANADGDFLGFYHEGVTILPEATGNAATDPAFTVKSYGYLGDTDEAHGVAASDMMYATVQVRHNIETNEELVTFAVPAALIPLITYEVTLGDNGELTALEQTGADYPIRLLYEVGLDPHINELNVMDYVSSEYLSKAPMVNDDGSINFYSNKFDVDGDTGYGTNNTYAYFNPSRQNDKYYYTEDAPVYQDNRGTLYTDTTHPGEYNGTLYRSYVVYEKNGSQLNKRTVYRPLSEAAKDTAQSNNGSWYIATGNVHVNLDGYIIEKGEGNLTDTLIWSNAAFVDANNHTVDDTSYSFVVGATLGNNGKLTLMPATGIKLTKEMAEGVAAPSTAFNFTIENLTNTNDSNTYGAILEAADGTQTETDVVFSDGKATVSLLAGQTLYITGLTADTQYKITENETDDYVAVTDTVTVTAVANQMVEANFVNAERGKGNLMITKEVAHAQAGHTVPESALLEWFWVKVDLGSAFAGKDVQINDGTTTGGWLVGNDGTLLLQVRHGQTLSILDLPEGTEVTVSEVTDNMPAFFSYDHINSRDYSGATLENNGDVTIGSNTNSTVIVHNTYKPASTKVDMSVKVNKNFVIESPLSETATFTFKLQQYVNGAWSDIDSGTITYDGDSGIKSITLPNALDRITFTEVGDYAYQIVEVIPADADRLPGVSYDRTTHTFSVHVTDNGGQLVATVMNDGVAVGDTHEVTFTNTYHTAPVSIDVVKEVPSITDFPELTKTGFAFEAYKANSDWTLADETAAMTVLSDAAGEARFADTYDAVGTHYFVIKEANSGKAGWSYDATEYRVTVEITEETDGNLAAEMTILKVTKDDTGAEVIETVTGNTITFSNTYNPKNATVNLDAAIRKNLQGRDLQAGEFTFAVFENGQASHTSTTGAKLTGTNAADGSVDFNGVLSFDKIGTYQYDIVEITGNLGGVDYSTRIYDLVVEVTDNGSGQLSANWYFEDATGQTVTFTNTYSAAETTYTVKGNKTLTGRALINDEFTFTMTEVADANGTPLNGGKTWETTNTMAKTFAFPAITYTAEGTHYYKVTEKQTGGADYGITYDETVYIVTVTVTDNGLGELVAEGSVKGGDNNTIAYENKYVPAKTSDSIPGKKTLDGKVLGAGAYSFQLYTSNDQWQNLGELGQPVANNADGSFQFPTIEYDTAGTYYYLVEEVDGGKTINGVTYDDSVFRVQVTVTDDLRGQLHAETVVFDESDIPQIGVEFVNVYQVTGDLGLVLSGSKTLNGRDLVNGEFTFELYDANDKYEETGNPIATGINNSGMYIISLDYTANNDLGKTYYYVLKEKNAGQSINGVDYVTTEHRIKVTLSDNGDGTMGMEVTTDGQKSTVNNVITVTGLNFTNTYTAKPAPITFSGTKDFKGNGMRELKANDFTFELYQADAQFVIDGAALTTITNAANGSFSFPQQELTTAGKHYFVIKERSTNPINGVIYDTAIYQATVTVSDDLEGKLNVDSITYQKVTNKGTTNATAILFENSYDPADATVSFSGIKSFNKALEADKFSFVLSTTNAEFIDNGTADPVTVGNAEDGTFTFGTKTFSRPDTYYFQIKEVNGGNRINGINYDGTKYNITVKVEDKDGKLIPTVSVVTVNSTHNTQATVAVNGTDATVTNVQFTNEYKAAATIPADLEGGKTVFGDWDLKADDFTFQIFKANDQFVIQGAAYKTATNDANGEFAFTDISLDTAGMHYFVIKESSENPINGMTYDPAVYHMSVKVEDDGKGQLYISGGSVLKITPEGTTTPNELLFTNSYDAEDATLSLTAKKVLQGKDLTAGEFTFQLQQTDDKFAPLAGTLPKQAVNAANGTVTFDAITYDRAGTYYYTVLELDTANERTTFDKAVYQVTVTVTDDNGVLKAVATYEKDSKAVDEMVFTNVYTPRPADLDFTFQVQKTVKNIGKETIGPEGFTFVLEENTGAKVEATTDKDGKASFQLTAIEEMIGHTFKLKLYEKNDGKANVTYSTAVYEITVTIRLGSDNKLVADLTVDGKATEQVNVAFENTYDYTIPATPHTGDSTPVVLLFSLLAISGMALAAAVIFRKKIIC